MSIFIYQVSNEMCDQSFLETKWEEKDRQRERQTDRETDRQTDRQGHLNLCFHLLLMSTVSPEFLTVELVRLPF